jgi:hypothetical protein
MGEAVKTLAHLRFDARLELEVLWPDNYFHGLPPSIKSGREGIKCNEDREGYRKLSPQSS